MKAAGPRLEETGNWKNLVSLFRSLLQHKNIKIVIKVDLSAGFYDI